MRYLMTKRGFVPQWYQPFDKEDPRNVEGHHVQQFYGAMMNRLAQGFPSIMDMYSMQDCNKHLHAVVELMPQDMFCDLHRLLHFIENFGNGNKKANATVKGAVKEAPLTKEEWEEVFEHDCVVNLEGTAQHRQKFAVLEDVYNERWLELVHLG